MTPPPPPPFTLVGDVISHDTDQALQQLLAMTRRRRNRLIGIAFGGMILGPDGRRCFRNAAGELYRSPLFAAGLISKLQSDLLMLADGENPKGWN